MKGIRNFSRRQGSSTGPGRHLRLLGFRDRRALFTVERWAAGLLSIELMGVTLEGDPFTIRQCARARRFAERQVLKALAV